MVVFWTVRLAVQSVSGRPSTRIGHLCLKLSDLHVSVPQILADESSAYYHGVILPDSAPFVLP